MEVVHLEFLLGKLVELVKVLAMGELKREEVLIQTLYQVLMVLLDKVEMLVTIHVQVVVVDGMVVVLVRDLVVVVAMSIHLQQQETILQAVF